jgi:hypothetical protein
VVVDDPSAFCCVVFFCLEEKAPERAPKRLRFSPAYASMLHQYVTPSDVWFLEPSAVVIRGFGGKREKGKGKREKVEEGRTDAFALA